MKENNQGTTDANLREIIEDMRAWRKEIEANRGATEACLESMEPTSLKIEF
jgi:hypothetical protein